MHRISRAGIIRMAMWLVLAASVPALAQTGAEVGVAPSADRFVNLSADRTANPSVYIESTNATAVGGGGAARSTYQRQNLLQRQGSAAAALAATATPVQATPKPVVRIFSTAVAPASSASSTTHSLSGSFALTPYPSAQKTARGQIHAPQNPIRTTGPRRPTVRHATEPRLGPSPTPNS